MLDRHPLWRGRLRTTGLAALGAVLAANLAMVAWYIVVGYRRVMHSDAAVENILAGEIHDTGRFFPPDFNFVNSDLWVLHGHTFIVPLVGFLPNTFALHAFSGIVSAALILAGTWMLAGLLTPLRWLRLACVATTAAAFSAVMADNVFGQVSYGLVFAWTCFHICFAWRYLASESPRRVAWLAAFAALATLMFWGNPQRALVSYGVPLGAAALLHGLGGFVADGVRSRETRRAAMLLAALAVASVAGILLHVWIIMGVHNVAGTGTALWLRFDEMVRNASNTVMGLLAMLGALPPPAAHLVRPSGVYQAMRLMGGVTVLVLAPWALGKALGHASPAVRFVGRYTLVAVLTVLFIQVATTVPDMVDPIQSARYLAPALLLVVLLLAVTVAAERERWMRALAGGVAVALLATSGYFALVLPVPPSNFWIRMADFLDRNGLRYGYASYWNAGVITLQTGGKVRVRQVLLNDGIPIPFRHLSSNRWYLPEAWCCETFLMVHPTEAPALDEAKLARYAGAPVRTLDFEGMKVLVFNGNLAESLPGWRP